MKQLNWQVVLGLSLIALSGFLYVLHFLIFRDAHHIFIYLLGDIAFIPIEVFLVTLVIHQLLNMREKRHLLQKLNMIIGTFFSEVGTELLTYFSDLDPNLDRIREDLIITSGWTEKEFFRVRKTLKTYSYGVDIAQVDLERLKSFLTKKRAFQVTLLENPNLLEHETFTELIRSVLHLTEELAYRDDLIGLPDTDYQHLAGDIKRAYTYLVYEWLDYMKYLNENYPFLFSLAMRVNPFDQKASPIVK